jgi:hypothetical protein
MCWRRSFPENEITKYTKGKPMNIIYDRCIDTNASAPVEILLPFDAFTKRQWTGALQDASRTRGPQEIAPASWSAAALRRFSRWNTEDRQTQPRQPGKILFMRFVVFK